MPPLQEGSIYGLFLHVNFQCNWCNMSHMQKKQKPTPQ